MLLSFVSQNLLYGGLRSSTGDQEDRWPELLKRITSGSQSPDFVLVQEAENWDKYSHKALGRAMSDLKMSALPLPPSSSGNLPGLLYRPETVGQWKGWNAEYSGHTVHGFGVAAFDVGLPSPLSVASIHLNFFSADLAVEEAALVLNRAYSYGPFAVIGGDMNYQPRKDPEPDFTKMMPYHYSMRTKLSEPGQNEPLATDRRVTGKYEQAALVDVAYHMFEKTGDKKYLEETATGGMRIDQFWVSQPLASAIVDYQIIDEPIDASDHKGIAFQLDTKLIDTSNIWKFH
jgi:endonuclease/exonuclease/phosphatase family metal-dependent hydrolase